MYFHPPNLLQQSDLVNEVSGDGSGPACMCLLPSCWEFVRIQVLLKSPLNMLCKYLMGPKWTTFGFSSPSIVLFLKKGKFLYNVAVGFQHTNRSQNYFLKFNSAFIKTPKALFNKTLSSRRKSSNSWKISYRLLCHSLDPFQFLATLRRQPGGKMGVLLQRPSLATFPCLNGGWPMFANPFSSKVWSSQDLECSALFQTLLCNTYVILLLPHPLHFFYAMVTVHKLHFALFELVPIQGYLSPSEQLS